MIYMRRLQPPGHAWDPEERGKLFRWPLVWIHHLAIQQSTPLPARSWHPRIKADKMLYTGRQGFHGMDDIEQRS